MANVVMDTHQYLAWSPALYTIESYCQVFKVNLTGPRVSKIKYEKWVGEWSLATDVCAHWLEGFNDARSNGYQYECQKVDCPKSYLPPPYDVDFDRSAAMLGPFGESTQSTIQEGKCLIDSAHFNFNKVDKFANCQKEVFDQTFDGQFFWNFRNELEPRWNYIEAYDQGWLNFKVKTNFLQ